MPYHLTLTYRDGHQSHVLAPTNARAAELAVHLLRIPDVVQIQVTPPLKRRKSA